MIRRATIRRALRRTALFLVALALVAVAWELYKWVGPDDGADVFGLRLIPRANDLAMPHVWEMLAEFGDEEVRGSDRTILQAVIGYSWYTFRIALTGMALGSLLGIGLAVVMARFKVVERGLLPYVVASQTVPLIALAPQVAALAGNWDLPKWTWASALAAFLSFFPVAVATLKGLTSAPAASLELMDSYAAGWWTTLRKLRFPAAVPYIVPGLKLAATGSVIGVIVSEISTGLSGGIGKAALQYSQKATAQPAQVYTAVFGAAAVGLAMFGIAVALEAWFMRNRPVEQTS